VSIVILLAYGGHDGLVFMQLLLKKGHKQIIGKLRIGCLILWLLMDCLEES